MCVYAYVCMCVYVPVRVCVHTGNRYACASVSVSTCAHVHECVGVCVRRRECGLMSIFVMRMQINKVHVKT
jgi:hypothetical protein